jgi:hypothetical protein
MRGLRQSHNTGKRTTRSSFIGYKRRLVARWITTASCGDNLRSLIRGDLLSKGLLCTLGWAIPPPSRCMYGKDLSAHPGSGRYLSIYRGDNDMYRIPKGSLTMDQPNRRPCLLDNSYCQRSDLFRENEKGGVEPELEVAFGTILPTANTCHTWGGRRNKFAPRRSIWKGSFVDAFSSKMRVFRHSTGRERSKQDHWRKGWSEIWRVCLLRKRKPSITYIGPGRKGKIWHEKSIRFQSDWIWIVVQIQVGLVRATAKVTEWIAAL